jgi:hypothetical protein
MANSKITNLINASMDLAVGGTSDEDMVGVPILQLLSNAGDLVPPWWSTARDTYLRDFWKRSGHLSMMVYTAESLLVGIPMRIEAKNPNIVAHAEEAELITEVLLNVSEFGETLYAAKRKFVEDYVGTDNGGFLEVIGAGKPDGPIEGMPLAVRHLDSSRCQRTLNKEFPVLYISQTDGKRYKLHRSRVIAMSQMTSAISEMRGVGFCSVSRSLQFAQHLYDIYVHKQEKLGSRPMTKLLVGAGIRGTTIAQAISVAQKRMTDRGLSRYGAVVGIGTDDTAASIEALDLNEFDPFDEETSVTLAMYAMSAAFGIPIQEVWPTGGARSGRNADIQESRQRGKLPAEFNAELELQIEQKYLPAHLRVVHDWRDDGEDQRAGVNKDIRARNRERDLGDNAVTIRVAREQMVEAGDATRDQFANMELEDGRLEDGTPVSVLFYSKDDVIAPFMNLEVEFPTDMLGNDIDEMTIKISTQIATLDAAMAVTSSARKRRKMLGARAALEWLGGKYLAAQIQQGMAEEAASMELQERPEDAEPEPEESGGPEAQGPREPDEVREGTIDKGALATKALPHQEALDTFRDDLESGLESDSDGELKRKVAAAFLLFFLLGSEERQEFLTQEDTDSINLESTKFNNSLDVIRDRQARGLDMGPTIKRVSAQASALYWLAFAKYAGDEELYTWEVGGTVKSCGDCLGFDGKTKTMKEWLEGGLLPQSPALECTGRHCDCGLYPEGSI